MSFLPSEATVPPSVVQGEDTFSIPIEFTSSVKTCESPPDTSFILSSLKKIKQKYVKQNTPLNGSGSMLDLTEDDDITEPSQASPEEKFIQSEIKKNEEKITKLEAKMKALVGQKLDSLIAYIERATEQGCSVSVDIVRVEESANALLESNEDIQALKTRLRRLQSKLKEYASAELDEDELFEMISKAVKETTKTVDMQLKYSPIGSLDFALDRIPSQSELEMAIDNAAIGLTRFAHLGGKMPNSRNTAPNPKQQRSILANLSEFISEMIEQLAEDPTPRQVVAIRCSLSRSAFARSYLCENKVGKVSSLFLDKARRYRESDTTSFEFPEGLLLPTGSIESSVASSPQLLMLVDRLSNIQFLTYPLDIVFEVLTVVNELRKIVGEDKFNSSLAQIHAFSAILSFDPVQNLEGISQILTQFSSIDMGVPMLNALTLFIASYSMINSIDLAAQK